MSITGQIHEKLTSICFLRALHGTGNCVWAIACDYKKAFDLIDHSLFMATLSQYDINPYIINWIAGFLSKMAAKSQTRELSAREFVLLSCKLNSARYGV